jgi:hypothetical protein
VSKQQEQGGILGPERWTAARWSDRRHQRHADGGRDDRAAHHLHGGDTDHRQGAGEAARGDSPVATQRGKLEIVLRRGGSIAIDGVSLAGAELLAEYLGARSPVPESLLVLIQADRDTPYAEVARVLAACRHARVREVALAAELRAGS